MKQILNTLNISDFICKCTNYNIIHIFITELSMVVSFRAERYCHFSMTIDTKATIRDTE